MTFLFWKSIDLLIATQVNDWTVRDGVESAGKLQNINLVVGFISGL